jgi:hypothetical protein
VYFVLVIGTATTFSAGIRYYYFSLLTDAYGADELGRFTATILFPYSMRPLIDVAIVLSMESKRDMVRYLSSCDFLK